MKKNSQKTEENSSCGPTDTTSFWDEILSSITPEESKLDSLTISLIEEIFRMLEEQAMTQKQLAELMKVSEAQVSKLLSGYSNMTLKSLAKILVALDADMHMKLTKKGDPFQWIPCCSKLYSAEFDMNAAKVWQASTSKNNSRTDYVLYAA